MNKSNVTELAIARRRAEQDVEAALRALNSAREREQAAEKDLDVAVQAEIDRRLEAQE